MPGDASRPPQAFSPMEAYWFGVFRSLSSYKVAEILTLVARQHPGSIFPLVGPAATARQIPHELPEANALALDAFEAYWFDVYRSLSSDKAAEVLSILSKQYPDSVCPLVAPTLQHPPAPPPGQLRSVSGSVTQFPTPGSDTLLSPNLAPQSPSRNAAGPSRDRTLAQLQNHDRAPLTPRSTASGSGRSSPLTPIPSAHGSPNPGTDVGVKRERPDLDDENQGERDSDGEDDDDGEYPIFLPMRPEPSAARRRRTHPPAPWRFPRPGFNDDGKAQPAIHMPTHEGMIPFKRKHKEKWLQELKTAWIAHVLKRARFPESAIHFQRWVAANTVHYIDLMGTTRPLFKNDRAVGNHIDRHAARIREISDTFDAWFDYTSREQRFRRDR